MAFSSDLNLNYEGVCYCTRCCKETQAAWQNRYLLLRDMWSFHGKTSKPMYECFQNIMKRKSKSSMIPLLEFGSVSCIFFYKILILNLPFDHKVLINANEFL